MGNTGPTYVVRNSGRSPCGHCNKAHEFVTGTSKDTDSCGTLVGFSKDKAEEVASRVGGEIEIAPGDEVVILDDSARKLPRQNPQVQLMIKETTASSFVKGG